MMNTAVRVLLLSFAVSVIARGPKRGSRTKTSGPTVDEIQREKMK